MHQYPAVFRCAVHSPLNRLFDYLPPETTNGSAPVSPLPGQRLWVPFGKRRVVAMLLEVRQSSDVAPAKMRHAEQWIDTSPLLNADHIQLITWITDYYHHPLGDTLFGFLPPLLRKGRDAVMVANPGASKAWQLSNEGKGLSDNPSAPALKRAPKQAELVKLLQNRELLTRSDLDTLGINLAVVRTMTAKGLIEETSAHLSPTEHTKPSAVTAAISPNAEQRTAIDAVIDDFGTYRCHLLHGITGSGKTEVYLQLIEHTLNKGKTALVLVPEIGLTPQMLQRFEQRFGNNIVAMHSNLTEVERLNAWLKASQNNAPVVVGTRSALLTPMPNLGLIVVDEEHDSSYKQQDGLRYSARDLAIKRAQLGNIPILLGSATPSLESLANTQQARFNLLKLTSRAGNAVLPSLHIADGSDAHCNEGVSIEILQALERHLSAGSQVLVFINRRGYAPALVCRQCGWMATCSACDSRMTAHTSGHKLLCHHCDQRHRWPSKCPDCNQAQLQTLGSGTQRLEEVLQSRFGSYPVIRVDRDSTQKKGELAHKLATAHEGKPCILLGTQMLAKGHHFPALSMVAILDADSALYSADFRGAERMAQTITQVAGRAGRSHIRGQVFIQSQLPDHPLLQSIITLPYESFAKQLLEERQRLNLPPFAKTAMVLAEHTGFDQVMNHLKELRHTAEQRLHTDITTAVSVAGPLPAPMLRKANRFRGQLVLFSHSSAGLHHYLAAIREAMDTMKAPYGLRLGLDVDPIDTN